ncbi:hypothetical protein HYPSUDRAFT_726122 [Hypholoma sublateritium FD-334 SS-4]|uniref:Uncharacterized protein n=1 Tax=Hypholoma sublateritium (strain FD-334 SS-4) TaxID=945553 RepID=A0A0D2MDG6_HYPSF|nr:hypothetical protein HYPSUDRAFT_726122 [Hypholoma sublateritium FD-334 SS-4]
MRMEYSATNVVQSFIVDTVDGMLRIGGVRTGPELMVRACQSCDRVWESKNDAAFNRSNFVRRIGLRAQNRPDSERHKTKVGLAGLFQCFEFAGIAMHFYFFVGWVRTRPTAYKWLLLQKPIQPTSLVSNQIFLYHKLTAIGIHIQFQSLLRHHSSQ